jgi:hypothetical protein
MGIIVPLPEGCRSIGIAPATAETPRKARMDKAINRAGFIAASGRRTLPQEN